MTDPTQGSDSTPDFSFLGADSEPGRTAKPANEAQPDSLAAAESSAPKNDDLAEIPTDRPSPVHESSSPKSRLSAKNSGESRADSAIAGEKSLGDSGTGDDTDAVSNASFRKAFNIVAGYAAALTILFVLLLLTGRISLSGNHQLESLPDIKPLQKGEFRLVPPTASLPFGHTLQLGQSQRFGDVILTPKRVTFEPIQFVHMTTGEEAVDLETTDVMKLWFQLENTSADTAFLPWDVQLMCHSAQRVQEIAEDDNTLTNTWLMVEDASTKEASRVLNFMQPLESSFNISGLGGDKLLAPGDSRLCFVASSQRITEVTKSAGNYRWRLQIRKGIHQESGNGVTTLVDVTFNSSQIETAKGV